MRDKWISAAVAAMAALASGCAVDVSIREQPEREGDDPGECYDGADNDGNGLFDCEDPQCAGAIECADNTAPTAPEISVSPEVPTTSDTLLCVIDVASTDPDGHAIEYRYVWTVNGEESGVEESSVDPGQTAKEEVWMCTVIPEDEYGLAGPSASASVAIVNAAPTRPEIGIEPSEPVPLDNLDCVIHEPSVDPDGDPVTYTYDWFKNGAPMGFGENGVPWQQTESPDEWACIVTPNDGIVDGPSDEDIVTVHVDVFPHPAAGSSHTCSVQMDGTYTCWGSDSWGQVSSAPDVSLWKIESGEDFSCGIVFSDTSLACWGDQTYDQHLPPLGTYVDIGVGRTHACAITSTGEAAFWGSAINWSDPVPDSGSAVEVTAGDDYCCQMNEQGHIDCWGSNAPTSGSSSVWVRFDGGADHLCAIDGGGDIDCWGDDTYGQVSGAPSGTYRAVTAGMKHTCAIEDSTGFVECWGDDSYGQSSVPTGVFDAISAGDYHTCGKRPNDTVDCWGCEGHDDGQCSPTL